MVMTKLRVRFGKNLKRLRNNRELTQEELAERIGISIEFVGLIERGQRAPSFDTIEKIAIALDTDVIELFR